MNNLENGELNRSWVRIEEVCKKRREGRRSGRNGREMKRRKWREWT